MTAPASATPAVDTTGDDLLVARHLRKSFGSVQALKDGSITVRRGTVTALIGDNGAGKSTLVRCLSGVHPPDGGELLFDGKPVRFTLPEQAQAAGIETVHQDLALVEELTVWQNLFLTREITRGFGPVKVLDRKAMRNRAKELVGSLAINVPGVTQRVRRLSGGQRQAVSIVRAAGWGSRMVIMDEPTAALAIKEVRKVLDLIKELKNHGISVILISHRMDDIFYVCDRIMALFHGRNFAEAPLSKTDRNEVIGWIMGNKSRDSVPQGMDLN